MIAQKLRTICLTLLSISTVTDVVVNSHAINVEPTWTVITSHPILLVSCLLALLANVCVDLFDDLFVHASAFHPFAALQHRSIVFSVRACFSCFVTASPLLAGSLFVPLSDGRVSTATTGGAVLLFDGGISTT